MSELRLVIVAALSLLSRHRPASSDALAIALNWLQIWAFQNVEFKMLKSGVKFSGCKQKEYLAALNQLPTENIILEIGLGY
jgi:hypothetical protein